MRNANKKLFKNLIHATLREAMNGFACPDESEMIKWITRIMTYKGQYSKSENKKESWVSDLKIDSFQYSM